MCILLHNNRVGISGNIIYFLTCFVRIPVRNSVNPIIPCLVFGNFIIENQKAEELHLQTFQLPLSCLFQNVLQELYIYNLSSYFLESDLAQTLIYLSGAICSIY